MSSPGYGAIGSLDYTSEERKVLAKKSLNWECPECGRISNLLSSSKSKPLTKEETEMINLISMKAEDHPKMESEFDAAEGKNSNVFAEKTDEKQTKYSTDNDSSIPSTRAQTERQQEIMPVMSESSSYRGFMWAVMAAIVLLIARRLFLM